MQEKKNYMNKIFGIIFFIYGCSFNLCLAQSTPNLFEISLKNGELVEIMNAEKFNFVLKNGHEFSGKVCILNDTQFCYYNYFNEAGSDTFNIKDVSDINLKGATEKYKIRPLLVIAGVLIIPVITIPVVIYKLVAKKNVHYWISKDEYSIKIRINTSET